MSGYLNHRDLFWDVEDVSVLAVMCLLMNEKSRKYFIPIKKINEFGEEKWDIEIDIDKAAMFEAICDKIKSYHFETKLGENINSFSGVTDGYWKDLETKDKKYMIISMESGDFVRSAGDSGGDLGRDDILNKFVILDGIDYKSNYSAHKLLYMEV